MHEIAKQRARRRYRIRLATKRLIERGYVTANGGRLSISVSGKELFKKAVQIRLTAEEKTWDGKWRVLIFDIPQSLAPLRAELRGILKKAGFQMLQQSVWIFPHDCKVLSDLIKQDARLKKRVLYGVFESIEGDVHMRRVFKLHRKSI
jgi:DNA-binding transcriptional regulator PaaX